MHFKLSYVLFEIKQYNQARTLIDKGLGNKNISNRAILFREQILLEVKIGNKNLAKNLLSKAFQIFENTKDEELFKELDKEINKN